MTESHQEVEPGEVPDPDLGFKTEEVPEVVGNEDPPENDQELGDVEPQETEDDDDDAA